MDYQRYIAYVYEYQNGKKRENSGFIKVEVQKGRCLLETHLRCKKNMGGIPCRIYAFVRKNGLLNGILLKECDELWDKLEITMETMVQNIGGMGIPLEKIGGILFISERGDFWGTQWDDHPIKPEFFREMTPAEEIQTMEIKNQEVCIDLEEEREEFFPFPVSSDFEKCWRITPAELAVVSGECCRLRFNRFLLYGYQSMGHLLLAKREDGSYLLGVPGYYDQQECFMAGMFGFPYFIESDCTQIADKKYGYWYRSINPPDRNLSDSLL